jgi:hypothetical protein
MGNGLLKARDYNMSQKYPECPLYNHSNCKDYEHPKLCAIVREDKICLKKKSKSNPKKLARHDAVKTSPATSKKKVKAKMP